MSELQVALIFLISSCSKDLLQELRCVSMWSHGLALCSDGQLQRNCMVHPCSLLHGPGARHQGFPNFLCSCANNCRGCCVVVISTHAAWFSLCSHGQLQRCCMDIPPPHAACCTERRPAAKVCVCSCLSINCMSAA